MTTIPPTAVSSICSLPILTPPPERVRVKIGSLGKIGKMGGLGGLGKMGNLGKMGKIGKMGKMGNLANRIREFAYIVGPSVFTKFLAVELAVAFFVAGVAQCY